MTMSKTTFRVAFVLAIILVGFPDFAHDAALLILAIISDILEVVITVLRLIQAAIDKTVNQAI